MAELSKIKFNGAEYDLKDAVAREAIENLPEDKIFPINVTLTSMTGGTSDKSHTEISAAVNAGKIPFVYVNYLNIKMIAPLARVESDYSVFVYEDQTVPDHLNYANLKIQGTNVTITWRDQYITNADLPVLATVATTGSYNDLSNTPTIPAAQVQSDWNATSGMGVILNKPDLSTYMVKGTDYVTAGQKANTTLGTKATAEGYNTTASGNYSHAEGSGTIASNICSHAEGDFTTASGQDSHAEGVSTTASGFASHTEGRNTTASGQNSHAEGQGTTAKGNSSHAEGLYTNANGDFSHAEGRETTASGYQSHAEGTGTTAQRKSQHVFGEYNVLDATGADGTVKGSYVEIIGNGTANDARSNARTLDWSGNEVLAGKLTVGAGPTANMDVATKQYVDNSIPTVPTNVSAFTNDADYTTLTDVQNFLLNPEVGIGRIRYEFVSELPDLENPELVLPNDFTIYIVEGDGWYKLNNTGDGWDKIIGFSNYISTTDHTQETPKSNTIYYNTTNHYTYIYDGTDWKQIGYIPPLEFSKDIQDYTVTYSNNSYVLSNTAPLNFLGSITTVLNYNGEKYYYNSNSGTTYRFTTLLDSNQNYKEFTLNIPTSMLGTVTVTSFGTYSAATITNTLSSGTLIATINGTNIYAPSYTDADGVSY